MEEKVISTGGTSFIQKNWQILVPFVVGIFTLGGIFAEFGALSSRIDDVANRQEKKVKIQNKLINEVNMLNRHHSYEEGYDIGYDKARREFEKKSD